MRPTPSTSPTLPRGRSWCWGPTAAFCTSGAPGASHDLAVGSDGSVYVAAMREVQRFSVDGTPISKWSGPGNGFGEIWGIDTSPLGLVYVADTYGNSIDVFTADGAFVTEWGGYGTRRHGAPDDHALRDLSLPLARAGSPLRLPADRRAGAAEAAQMARLLLAEALRPPAAGPQGLPRQRGQRHRGRRREEVLLAHPLAARANNHTTHASLPKILDYLQAICAAGAGSVCQKLSLLSF